MKSPFKRLLSLCLCLVLVAVALPVSPAEAAENDPLKYLSYEITNGTVTITDCDTSFTGRMVLPDTIEGLPVTKIGERAFSGCHNLRKITLGNYVTTIGPKAFQSCWPFTIIIPASVTSIGYFAFESELSTVDMYFLGDPPSFSYYTFGTGDDFGIIATVYYPIHNSKWTSSVRQFYGASSMDWVAIHDRDEGILTAPTCAKKGSYQYTCTTCGEIETETIPRLPHSYDEGILAPAPTCTAEGSRLYTCTACGDTKTTTLSALGHSWDEGTLVTAPTCTTKGSLLHTCTACGDTKTETVWALGHSYKGILTSAPTCTTEGSRLWTCTTCGATLTDSLWALGHSLDEGTVISLPTCTEPGQIDYTCKTCGDVIRKETPDATGHQFQRGVWVTQPGCDTTGQKSYTCSTCGFIKYATFAAKGHTEVTDPGFAPTCTSTGLTDGTHCTTCNQVVIPQEVIPIVHSYKTVAVNATCTEDGSITSTCTLCGHISIATIPAPGHSYEAVVIAPTCTQEGTNTSTCTTCGDVIVGTIPATGHQFEDGSCIHCGEPEAVSLPGDVNGDGKVNIMDVAKLYAHIKGTLLIEDETQLRQADLTGDGNVNILDIAKLYASVKGTE